MNTPPGAIPIEDDQDLFNDGTFISAQESPEAATAASQAALDAVHAKPQMPDADPGLVDLPGGWMSPDKVLHKQAIVRELTGRDEERLARVNQATNLPLYLQTMVECGVELLGGQKPSRDDLRELLIGDREALILGIRMATYGDELEMDLTCPKCSFQERIRLELRKDIPVKRMETPEIREYDVPLRKGRVATVRPATAGMQDEVWDANKTVAELRSATLQQCVLSIDGRPVEYSQILDLGLADRNTLLNFLAGLQPGPDYGEVRLDCSGCSESLALDLTLADLFRSE